MAEIAITVGGTPWIIDDVNLTIRRDENTSPLPDLTNPLDRVESLELYSSLQDRFDEPDLMDADVPMSAQTPNAFTLINGWFIDEGSLRYLTGGAITTSGWSGVIRKITLDAAGYVGPTTDDLGGTVTSSASGDTGSLIGFRNDTREWWVRVVTGGSPDNLFDAAGTISIAGSTSSPIPTGTQSTAATSGEYLYTNLFTLGSISDNTDLYIIQDQGNGTTKVLPQFWGTGFIDVLVKVRDSGTLLDAGRVQVFARQYTQLYDNFSVDLSVGGRQPVPLATQSDLNNTTGYRSVTFTQDSPELSIAADDVLSVNGVVRAKVTEVIGPTSFAYYLLYRDAATGDFVDFTAAEVVTAEGKTGSVTIASTPIEYGPGQRTISPLDYWEASTVPTVAQGAVAQNLGTGTATAPYSITIDCQGATLAQVYEWCKYATRRNAKTTVSPSDDPIFLAMGLDGEQYKGIEARLNISGGSPTFAEGELVTGGTSGATARVMGNHVLTGQGNFLTVYELNGTFSPGETLTGGTSGATTTLSTVSTRTPTKQSPLGTFAGGTFFGAPGVYLTNMDSADIQNYQLVDDNGVVQVPPNAVAVTVRGLSIGDRVAVFELDAPFASNGEIIRNKFTLLAGSPDNIAGGTTLTVATTGISPDNIPFDTPSAGVVRVRDVSLAEEERYRYSSFLGNSFTLVAIPDATATAGGDSNTLLATGSTFVTDGVEIGDMIRNVTDGSVARVLKVVSQIELETTVLTGGADNTYQAADTIEINKLVKTYVNGSDTAYAMLLDRVADTSVETSATLIYESNINALVRVRFSSPLTGSPFNPIQPFETGGTVGTSGLDVTAIRTPDNIATE